MRELEGIEIVWGITDMKTLRRAAKKRMLLVTAEEEREIVLHM
jgi:hypothetical protein